MMKPKEALNSSTDIFFELCEDLLVIAGFDGYFKKLSQSWTTVLGWSTEELCSRPYVSFVHPNDITPTSREAKRLSEDKKVLKFENRYLAKNGTYRWLEWTARSDRKANLIYAVAREKSEQKIQELKLKESESRWQNLMKMAPVGIFQANAEGRFVYMNEAFKRMVERPLSEIGDTDWRSYIHPDDLAFTLPKEAAPDDVTSLATQFRLQTGGCPPNR